MSKISPRKGTVLIRQAKLVNEGKTYHADVYIQNGIIEKIDTNGISMPADRVIHAEDQYLLPGVIDDQVHFREPGLTHKADIYTESKAAVAGGITSYMEMPNTVPNAVTIGLLEDKYALAAGKSLANFSFFMGTTDKNLEELMKVDETNVCGIKVFMGSSTGDMLVDDPLALENIFRNVKTLIAAHCEFDPMIRQNQREFVEKFGEDLSVKYHGQIRSAEACFKSTQLATELAKKHRARLHVLHVSTAKELALFRNDIPLAEKKITAEACVHHLWFSEIDYDTKGNYIKWNPAIKTAKDREALFNAVLDDRIDVIATDHAPHTIEEKEQPYLKAPSGGPLVQHSLNAMLEFYKLGRISLEKIVEKMCHNPAILFEIDRRGFIREGYHADLALVDLHGQYTVSKDNLLYKCKWSPFEGNTFHSRVTHTLVNGHVVYANGKFDESVKGMRLKFNR